MDHPRSRGVYLENYLFAVFLSGSSPLARGLLRTSARTWSQGRIIPARAGFTNVLYPHSLIIGDHPRSRGVYQAQSTANIQNQGSSPLARGLLNVIHTSFSVKRIIPARAGFTFFG